MTLWKIVKSSSQLTLTVTYFQAWRQNYKRKEKQSIWKLRTLSVQSSSKPPQFSDQARLNISNGKGPRVLSIFRKNKHKTQRSFHFPEKKNLNSKSYHFTQDTKRSFEANVPIFQQKRASSPDSLKETIIVKSS